MPCRLRGQLSLRFDTYFRSPLYRPQVHDYCCGQTCFLYVYCFIYNNIFLLPSFSPQQIHKTGFCRISSSNMIISLSLVRREDCMSMFMSKCSSLIPKSYYILICRQSDSCYLPPNSPGTSFSSMSQISLNRSIREE